MWLFLFFLGAMFALMMVIIMREERKHPNPPPSQRWIDAQKRKATARRRYDELDDFLDAQDD